MNEFRPPADAWSRRDFMRNGSYSIALLCTFAAPGSLKSKGVTTSAARRSQAASPLAPFGATCRSSPSSRRRRRRPARMSTT